ncbi:MAG: PQQ-binding-like beta-propeller repeat protein, partial [Planctomycetes bacterium]|nr:PQQ-binding-like beta-propeller repeat protein [Planctomycetota bacterium]
HWQKLLSSDNESVGTANGRRKVEQRFWHSLVRWLDAEPAARDLIAPQMRELSQAPGVRRQIELSHSLARSLAAGEDRVAALDRFFQTLNLNPAGDEAVHSPGDPLRMVRHDRLLQGELLDLIPRDKAKAAALAELRSRVAEQLQQARSSPDPFAAQRLAELLSAHPWAVTLRLDEKAEVGRTFLQKQISLLQLAESDDLAVAARALERLAELYGNRSHELDATASTLRLVNRLSGKVNAKTRDLLKRPDEIPDRKSLIEKLERSDWDGLTASAEIETRSTPASTYVRVSVECEAGSLFDRLEVAVTTRVQRNKRTIRFCGDGEAGAWKLEMPVPQNAASRSFLPPHGWGIGHLLILELGGELLAISPYSQNGEPKPVLVWSRDIIAGDRLASPQIRRGIPGFQLAALNYLDPFDRPMAVTGPVRSGYLCVQTRGRLLCLDPVTGKQFWERYGLPAEAVVSGDAESVFLIDTRRGQVEQLRVIDGAAVASHSLSGFGEAGRTTPTILATNSSRLLVRHGDDDDSPAEVLNLKTGEVSWTLPAGARHLFRADLNTIGHLSTAGELVLRELVSGREVSRMKPDLPDTVDRVECVRDRTRWFIAIHSVKNATAPAARYASLAPLNGPLVAISRTDGRVLWQEYIKDAQLPLVQHGSVPILVLAWTQQSKRVPANNRVVDTVYHLIDKRTGETILEDLAVGSNAAFLIEPDPGGRRVEIQTNRRTFRVDFGQGE